MAGSNTLYPRIYNLLLGVYGPQGWWPVDGTYFPDHENPFEVVVGAILTQNTAWHNAAMAIERLRSRGLLSVQGILGASRAQLTRAIRCSGYYNQKSERLKHVARFLHKASGATPSREELLAIKGIGPETADSILLYAYHVPVFIIDAYTRRIYNRIGLTHGKMTYEEMQDYFMKRLPVDEKLFNEYHALIVRHAKHTCGKIPGCSDCVVAREGLCSCGIHAAGMDAAGRVHLQITKETEYR
jgi:endonuclease-3 related protein